VDDYRLIEAILRIVFVKLRPWNPWKLILYNSRDRKTKPSALDCTCPNQLASWLAIGTTRKLSAGGCR
jgi:hypothetical protein